MSYYKQCKPFQHNKKINSMHIKSDHRYLEVELKSAPENIIYNEINQL